MAGDSKMGNDIDKGQEGFIRRTDGTVVRAPEGAAPVAADAGRRAGRRGFLAGAGAAGAGAAAAALAARPSPPQVADGPEPARKKAPLEAGRGYHETAHIRKYYDTTKV